MWIFFLCLGLYLFGAILHPPVMLRRRMLVQVCTNCGTYEYSGDHRPSCFWGENQNKTRWQPLGARRARNGEDVAVALGFSAIWLPFWLVIFGMRLSKLTGRTVTRLVLVATPLTAPEKERRSNELELRTAKLSDEIGVSTKGYWDVHVAPWIDDKR